MHTLPTTNNIIFQLTWVLIDVGVYQIYYSNIECPITEKFTDHQSVHVRAPAIQFGTSVTLLFIIYMNDIAQVSKLFDFIIYADDTTHSTTIEIVVRTTTNVPISDILNNGLSMVTNRLKVNKIIIKHKEKQIYYLSYKKKNILKLN